MKPFHKAYFLKAKKRTQKASFFHMEIIEKYELAVYNEHG